MKTGYYQTADGTVLWGPAPGAKRITEFQALCRVPWKNGVKECPAAEPGGSMHVMATAVRMPAPRLRPQLCRTAAVRCTCCRSH